MGDAFIYHGDDSKRKQFAHMLKNKNRKIATHTQACTHAENKRKEIEKFKPHVRAFYSWSCRR